MSNLSSTATPTTKPKRFVGRKSRPTKTNKILDTKGVPHYSTQVLNQVPDNLLKDENLLKALTRLPSNYNFEIPKTLLRVKQLSAKIVALQFPEGLLLYATIISDILQEFTGCECIIMGDVTYGACCVDDFTARALGAELLVHYGHSCLVPINAVNIKTLYVFVDIKIDIQHFIETIKFNFEKGTKMAIVGTIQFGSAIQESIAALKEDFPSIWSPQTRPLSPGEILGCTSPKIDDTCQALIYLADGRFHLESVMISNPHLKAFRYDPYSKTFSVEKYDIDTMRQNRLKAIQTAKTSRKVGLILGTLGRQGNPDQLDRIRSLLDKKKISYTIVLLSEIFPAKLQLFEDIEAWVQVACPRLSIDWGYAFDRPLLNPYEAYVAFGDQTWEEIYPMDYYSKTGGSWSVYSTD